MMSLQRTRLLLAVLALTAYPLAGQVDHSESIETLQKNFLNPPNDAKPMVRWWWFGVAVTKPEILRELQHMKADGIGGAELAFVYPEVLDDPALGLKNLSFLSPEMLEAVHYAQFEGHELGLRIDVTLCSGWPYGGPATTLTEAAGHLRTVATHFRPGDTATPSPPLQEGESFLAASIVKGDPEKWDAASAQPLKLYLSGITTAPADYSRTLLFFIASHSRQQVKRAAVGGEGYVLDPLNHQAVATHLQTVGERLMKAFGSTPPYAIFSDSLEAYGADWTPNLPSEFLQRRGYDLIPHLPELVAGGSPAADKVRHDYGRTLTELVNENYLTQINSWAIAHRTKFRSQTYGEPAVSFSSQNLVGLAEGEGPHWREFSTLRWASSANHVFGHNVTSGETFTWLHSPVFRATPLDMKAEADIDFIMGENQLIFHGWPYSAPGVPEPGWSLYAAGAFNDHNPWHPVLPSVTAYITRISWLLRQGMPANQVAILLPTDDAWASFSPEHVSVSGAMQKLVSSELMSAILSAGYNVDFIDADAINEVGLGSHQILVLPPTDRLPIATLRKIRGFMAHGGKVIIVGHVPTMDERGDSSPELIPLPEAIVVVTDTAKLALALKHAATPDLALVEADDATKGQVAFIRRSLPNADIYYVTNTGNTPVRTTAQMATKYTLGERLDTETGKPSPRTIEPKSVDLDLAPYESNVFVFDYVGLDDPRIVPRFPLHKYIDLSTGWKINFSGIHKTIPESLLVDWIDDSSTRHYSGEAVYANDFELGTVPDSSVYLQIDGGTALPGASNSPTEPEALGANGLPNPLVTRTGPGMHAYYDPPIREAGLVTINGQPAGALWHPPYRLDITKLLKAGKNHIEIRVYNTALNAWSALPPHDYKPLIEKYGDRFQMQDLNKVQPISSGILGTIHLVTQEPQ